MEKYFVTYAQSIALKKLGFDMPCFAYIYIGDTGNNIDRYEEVEPSRAINFNHDSLCVSQPLKSQVFEWFDYKTFTDIEEKPFKLRGIITHKETGYFGCEIRTWRFDNNVGKWKREMILKSEQHRGVIESYAIDKLIETVKNNLYK